MSDEYKHVPLKFKETRELHPKGTAERIAALEAQLAEREWRPIESAPKDGTWISLCKFGREMVYTSPTGKTTCWWLTRGQWSKKWDRWWDGFEPSGLANPTHWQPLPQPPKEPK